MNKKYVGLPKEEQELLGLKKIVKITDYPFFLGYEQDLMLLSIFINNTDPEKSCFEIF